MSPTSDFQDEAVGLSARGEFHVQSSSDDDASALHQTGRSKRERHKHYHPWQLTHE
jgi:hypothetical protein